MIEWFIKQDAYLQALMATLFTWALTAIGASVVFFFKRVSNKLLNTMMGFSAGIMIAASIWSLIMPAIDLSQDLGGINFMPVTVGIILGGLFLYFADVIIDNNSIKGSQNDDKKRGMLLIISITLHNIPEGFAIGVAFGAYAIGLPGATLGVAVLLAVGIGIQNLPEGAAVSLPLRKEGMSRNRAFFYGQISGFVEPFMGVLGAIFVMYVRSVLPYTLGFAAGAMLFVAVKELIPSSQDDKASVLPTFGFLLGFIVMMILDIMF